MKFKFLLLIVFTILLAYQPPLQTSAKETSKSPTVDVDSFKLVDSINHVVNQINEEKVIAVRKLHELKLQQKQLILR